MQFLSFPIASVLLLQVLGALPALGYPSDNLAARDDGGHQGHDDSYGGGYPPRPVKTVLKFDDIPLSDTSDFTQLGNPGGVPFVYNGFKFYQEAQWLAVACTHFPPTNPYYKSCGGSTQSIWTPGNTPAPVAILSGPSTFDVDSFFITPVVFGTREVTMKVTGRYAGSGQPAKYEKKITTDTRTEIKGLDGKGFRGLKELEIRVYEADGKTFVPYAIDDVVVKK